MVDQVKRLIGAAKADANPVWSKYSNALNHARLRLRAGCGYQKPNPDRVAGVDLAVAGDQLGGAGDCRLQVAR